MSENFFENLSWKLWMVRTQREYVDEKKRVCRKTKRRVFYWMTTPIIPSRIMFSMREWWRWLERSKGHDFIWCLKKCDTPKLVLIPLFFFLLHDFKWIELPQETWSKKKNNGMRTMIHNDCMTEGATKLRQKSATNGGSHHLTKMTTNRVDLIYAK